VDVVLYSAITGQVTSKFSQLKSIIKPINTDQRIGSLDFLRGVAVLGILVINVESFAYPDPWSPYKFGFAGEPDHQTRFWVYFLAQGKFYSMFTLLFGVSFYMFFQRAEEKVGSGEALKLLSRRLLALFIIGVAHAYLLWDGDVLYHYAVCGFLLFPFRIMSNRQLMLSITVLAIPILYNSYKSTERNQARLDAYEQTLRIEVNKRSEEQKMAVTTWERMTTPKSSDVSPQVNPRTSWLESVALNAEHSRVHRGYILYQGLVFRTLIMMILGMVLCRLKVFEDYRLLRHYWVVTVVIVLAATAVNYFRYDHWTFHYYEPVTSVLQGWLFAFPKELLGLGYILLLNGLYQKLRTASSYEWIRNTGRMALTVYILQSVLCAFLFYGFTLDFYNQWSRSELILVVPLLWIPLILFANIWLRKYHQGPLESLWRRFTYFK